VIWPKIGCASLAYAAMPPVTFFPCRRTPPFLAQQQSFPDSHPPLRFGQQAGAASIAFGRTIAIEAAMVRARTRNQGD
jgi:hypothetical protein